MRDNTAEILGDIRIQSTRPMEWAHTVITAYVPVVEDGKVLQFEGHGYLRDVDQCKLTPDEHQLAIKLLTQSVICQVNMALHRYQIAGHVIERYHEN